MPETLKAERWERFMQVQAGISRARLQRRIGRRISVLVDEIEGDVAIARSSADAPEIDGVVRIEAGGRLQPGDLVEVDVTAAADYDLSGRLAATRAA